nr:hypothetical protein [uncultured bacterium]
MRSLPERTPDHLLVMHQIAVTDFDSLRFPRRAGSVLKEGQSVAVYIRVLPGFGQIDGQIDRDAIGAKPVQIVEGRSLRQQRLHSREDRVSCKRHFRLRIFHDGLQTNQRTIRARRIDGYGYRSGIETTQEGRDITQPRWVEQKYTLSRHPSSLQLCSDGACLLIQLRVS